MVYDCFQFFNELDILKLRLHIMNPVVDRFVISEATETFSGNPKPLYYEENKEMFAEFADKIIHVVVDDTPPGYTHDRDTFQKNAVGRGLKDCTDEDIIIFSDLDEIPNPEKIKEVLQNFDRTKIYHFAQRLFYCYLNMEEVSGNLLSYAGEFPEAERSKDGIPGRKKWIGSKMCSYSLLKGAEAPAGRAAFPGKKGLWHPRGGRRLAFWLYGRPRGKDVKKRVAEKVRSAAHQEYNKAEVLSDVADRIKDGKDIFGRNASFVQVEIDETFPEYLRENQEEYSFLILKEEPPVKKGLRHMLGGIRRFIFRTGHLAKRVLRKIKG